MSKIALAANPSGVGTVTLESPNTGSDYTISLPAETGQALTTASVKTSNIHAFSIGYTTIQPTFSANTYTKILYDTEYLDSGNIFDTSTSRLTPTIPGWYQLTAGVLVNATAAVTGTIGTIYKNGAEVLWLETGISSNITRGMAHVTGLLYFNGTTDYAEVFAYIHATTAPVLTVNAGPSRTYFTGFLVKT